MRVRPARAVALCVVVAVAAACAPEEEPMEPIDDHPGDVEPLPAPEETGPRSLEEGLAERRSVRTYADRALSEAEIGQLLWAAQGLSDPSGKRTAPSAGATYPLEVHLATAGGLAHYDPEAHSLERLGTGDLRGALADAALGQESVAEAPVVIVLSGIVERTEGRYGERAERYVVLEAGHAAQNVLLQAVALDLASVPIGAFDDDEVRAVLGLDERHTPLYLLPVGAPGS